MEVMRVLLHHRGRVGVATTIQTDESTGVDEQPCCAYELINRMQIEDLARDVQEQKDRINLFLWGVLSAVVIDIVLRLIH